MNISKSFLEDLRSRISLSDLIGEKVSWDEKKSRVGQGDFWAPCPFHDEKTASFHVDANKGFYYCFGCHVKGDCFTFLKEYDNLSFPESVTVLAQRAGIKLPVGNKFQKESEKNKEILYEINHVASQFFVDQLNKTDANGCQRYIKERGINKLSVTEFGIGFAPKSSNKLCSFLKNKGFETTAIIESGLCMISENDKEPFDRFRNRLMFPIKDERNKIIAFGGRALDVNAKAKYLNSPETSIFSKGQIIYNYSNARTNIKKGSALLVVEGYMDVIALFQAGFPNAVAPMGTAMTLAQLRLLWRLNREPIILLDGDKAGRNATASVLSLALPFIEANQSLRFGILPVGQDPDDILKSEGIESLRTIMDGALPLIDMLWNNLTENQIYDSPERKASLDLKLNEQIKKIKNSHLRHYFSTAVKEKKQQFFYEFKSKSQDQSAYGSNREKQSQFTTNSGPLIATRHSKLSQKWNNIDIEVQFNEGVILVGAMNHPTVAYELENELSKVNFKYLDLKKIRDAILEEIPISETTSTEEFQRRINDIIKFNALQILYKIPHLELHPYLLKTAGDTNAKIAIIDAIRNHNSINQLNKEIEIAKNEITHGATEDLTSRIKNANRTLRESRKGSESPVLNTDEMMKESSERLNLMIKGKIWLKKK